MACALRETYEELGLRIPDGLITWGRRFPTDTAWNWFFGARLAVGVEQDIIFGDEGQCWQLMEKNEFLHHPSAVPQLKDRLGCFLAETS